MKGEDEPRELVLMLSQAQVRNSTLWASDPRQQLAYLAVKRWARLYCPDVILGVYSADELEERTEREINPAPAQRVSLKEIASESVTTTPRAQESTVNIDSLADDFRDRIKAAQDMDTASAIRSDVEAAKSILGNTLYTELKNKAIARYYHADYRNRVEAAINSLPQPGEPDAVERLAEAERTLTAAKRHLGDELHDMYTITLNNMKPEYIRAG